MYKPLPPKRQRKAPRIQYWKGHNSHKHVHRITVGQRMPPRLELVQILKVSQDFMTRPWHYEDVVWLLPVAEFVVGILCKDFHEYIILVIDIIQSVEETLLNEKLGMAHHSSTMAHGEEILVIPKRGQA